MDRHASEVSRISSRLSHFYATNTPFRVYHGSTNSTRPSTKTRSNTVDTSALNRVLSVDVASRIASVEPNVGMGMLAEETLRHGLIPPVVMEFPGITAGGGFSGTSGESSSFKHGLFEATVEWVEIVLADGEVVRASREERRDLFFGAASAFGTLGVVTLLGIRLVPAGAYVRLEYHLARSLESAVDTVRAQTEREENDFVDGIVYARDRSVICAGRMVPSLPHGQKAVRFSRRHNTWFYLRAERHSRALARPGTAARGPAVDYVPLTDYLFRYDHGAFWGGKLAFLHFHVPQNRLTRRLADPFLDSRTCYHALHKSGLACEYVVQDFGIPASNVGEFVAFVNETLPDLMVFLAPCMPPRDLGLSSRFHPRVAEIADQRLFAVGVYGRGPRDPAAFRELNRKLELRSAELLGAKLLYARTYYTEEEFWTIYDKDVYDQMRKKYRAEGLPTVFEKLKADMNTGAGKRRPVRGILETMWDKAVGNKEYLLKR
ncbi:hypothetical protein VUR80DRAFT_7006 [Thermomyces stellatus]